MVFVSFFCFFCFFVLLHGSCLVKGDSCFLLLLIKLLLLVSLLFLGNVAARSSVHRVGVIECGQCAPV